VKTRSIGLNGNEARLLKLVKLFMQAILFEVELMKRNHIAQS